MHRIIVLAALLAVGLPPLTASAASTVFLGQGKSQAYTGYADCPPDSFCWHVWYRWKIRVERTLTGPQLPASIVAVMSQHTGLVRPYPHRVFVVSPIEDPETRARLHADYFVDDMATAAAMQCMELDPRQLGLDVQVFANGDGTYCFEVPPVPPKD